MDLPSDLLPASVLWLSLILFAWLLWRAVRAAPWGKLRDNEAMHVFLGTCVILLLLWNLRAGVAPGLNFHILAVTSMTLMFGWAFALFGVCLILVGSTLMGPGGWETFALNALLMGAIPILLTRVFLVTAQRWLPHNFFIYIFINAFLAAGLGALLTTSAAVLILTLSDVYSFKALTYEYLPYFPLMFFSEAVLNGMLMTVLVAVCPAWVASFDDDLYLKGK